MIAWALNTLGSLILSVVYCGRHGLGFIKGTTTSLSSVAPMTLPVPIMKLPTLYKGSKKFGSALILNMQFGSLRQKHCPILYNWGDAPVVTQIYGRQLNRSNHLQQQPMSTSRESQQFRSLDKKKLFKELQLYITLQSTIYAAEWPSICLRRLNTYMRTTMAQERLNYVTRNHIHKQEMDKMNRNEQARPSNMRGPRPMTCHIGSSYKIW